MDRTSFLPVSRDDMLARGWTECDFVFVTGDAYVDHPSFAAALLGRLLESEGYRVAVLAQPEWKGPGAERDFLRFGIPRLAWLVSAGAMDSMVSHYTANKKLRSSDAYSPGGKPGLRPDRVLLAYTAVIRAVSKKVPVLIGGIEASLRRFGHYDYWSDTVKHSILLDTKADLLMYGMGEHSIIEAASRLRKASEKDGGSPDLRGIRGTMWRTGKKEEIPPETVFLPSFQEIKSDIKAYCRHFVLLEQNADPFSAALLAEKSEERYIVQEPPSLPVTPVFFDRVMELPYTREWHPDYTEAGGIPALAEVQFSLTSSRGCFGACAFCAIAFHQGKHIQTRSPESLVREAEALTARPGFKGFIHDVGGPTANFRIPACKKQIELGSCRGRQCLGSEPCPNLGADHRDYISVLRKIRAVPGVKKVFIRSGLRFDYIMLDPDGKNFLRELCEHHVSGQLKVAPEHSSDRVLRLMRKSSNEVYHSFEKAYAEMNRRLNKKQYLVPYYIAGLPGATLEDALHTALELKKSGFVPDQVQDFYPTPGTLATCMYYTGLDPYTGDSVYIPRGTRERSLQRALLQFNRKENRKLVTEALRLLKREDLSSVLR